MENTNAFTELSEYVCVVILAEGMQHVCDNYLMIRETYYESKNQ